LTSDPTDPAPSSSQRAGSEPLRPPAGGPGARPYLAAPDGGGPGVLVLHDYYGLLPSVREQCDALAEAGMVALAPDLYGGRVAADDGEAEGLMGDLELAKARAWVGEAVAWLRASSRGRIGGVGSSMGGALVLLEATTGSLDAVVVYYATLAPASARQVTCPVLAHFAEDDEWDPEETPDRFVEALGERGEVERFTYPGTEHSFANDGIPARFEPTQAAAAWRRTVEFLRRHLAG
jgi:carboxymethylenebutenolidase